MAEDRRNPNEYIVVIRNPEGVATWGVHKSKEAFDEHRRQRMKDGSGKLVSEVYEVVAEGVASVDEAVAICSSRRNNRAILGAELRRAHEIVEMGGEPNVGRLGYALGRVLRDELNS